MHAGCKLKMKNKHLVDSLGRAQGVITRQQDELLTWVKAWIVADLTDLQDIRLSRNFENLENQNRQNFFFYRNLRKILHKLTKGIF